MAYRTVDNGRTMVSSANCRHSVQRKDTHLQTIYNHIHADKSGKLLANTRHKGKYNRKTEKNANRPKPPTFRTAPVSTTGPRRLTEHVSATGRWILSSERMATEPFWFSLKGYLILHHRKAAAWKERQRDCQSRHQTSVRLPAYRRIDHYN